MLVNLYVRWSLIGELNEGGTIIGHSKEQEHFGSVLVSFDVNEFDIEFYIYDEVFYIKKN